MKWAKSFKEEHKTPRENSDKTLALSAFMLTSLPTSIAQKTLIREMWNSGANTIVRFLITIGPSFPNGSAKQVLIDHNTREGFEVIAYAREYILQLSKAELDDPDKASSDLLGSHVVAPVSILFFVGYLRTDFRRISVLMIVPVLCSIPEVPLSYVVSLNAFSDRLSSGAPNTQA